MMNNDDEQFNEIVRKAKHISLSEHEKAQIKSSLITFIKTYSAPKVAAKPMQGWFAWQSHTFNRKFVMQFAAISLVITGLASYGVSSAAQGALPGDFLYPIKTQVNEKVVEWLQFSARAKADYNIRLVNVRLEEIETIAAEQTLNVKKSATVTNLLDNHIVAAQKKIQDIRNEKQEHEGLEAASELEVSLNGHAEVLTTLQLQQKNTQLEAIVLHIRGKAQQAQQEKQERQSAFSKEVTTTKSMAETKLNGIKIRLAHATQLLEEHKNTVNRQTHAKAQVDLYVANQSIEQGNAQINLHNYTQAFIHLQDALNKIEGVIIYLSQEISLTPNSLPLQIPQNIAL